MKLADKQFDHFFSLISKIKLPACNPYRLETVPEAETHFSIIPTFQIIARRIESCLL